jgi:hypothetical protein
VNSGSTARTPSAWDIFISYANIDRVPVERLVKKLKEDGFRVWYDVEQVGAGETTLGQLVDGIASSEHMIACLSDAYLQRDWTAFELQTNQTLDPANQRNRTIPAKVDTLTKELPLQIKAITYADLSDPQPERYEAAYQKLRRLITPPPSAPPQVTEIDLETLAARCETPFKHINEPNVALFQVRMAVAALCQFLYRQQLGRTPDDLKLDSLVQKILTNGNLPPNIKITLETVQRYGNFAVKEDMGDYVISQEFVQPGLAALRVLWDWTRETYRPVGTPKKDLWNSILEQLPYRRGEREIPGSDYTLKPKRISLNSLGPLYSGWEQRWGRPVAINLVALAEGQEVAFFDEIAQFIRLNHIGIVHPTHADRVVIDGKRLCLYVVLDHIDGASAQDLVDRFDVLPELVACELCRGVAVALEGLHNAEPPIIHGDTKPANIVVDRFGQVKVLCVGRNVGVTAEHTSSGAVDGKIDSFLFSSPEQLTDAKNLTAKTDLFALRAMLFYLLTGEYEARVGAGNKAAQLSIEAQNVLEKLSACETASQAHSILETACQKLGDHRIHLRSVIDTYLKGEKLPPVAYEPPPPTVVGPPPPEGFKLLTEFAVEGRGAWPLGGGRVLAWETGTNILTILEDSKPLWRDSQAISLRRVIQGPGSQWAAISWHGYVRCFAGGKLTAAINLNGAIGDACFCSGRWVIGTWKHALASILPDSGREVPLPPGIDKGVFRIAAMGNGEWFAVADLSGGIALYSSWTRRCAVPTRGPISSMAFAGKRLIVLRGSVLFPVDLEGRTGLHEQQEDALYLLPGLMPNRCLLITEQGESWTIDEQGRRELYVTFPPGYTLSSGCKIPKRFILRRPESGYAYLQDGKLEFEWPDALSVTLAAAGDQIAVTLPGKILLYEAAR